MGQVIEHVEGTVRAAEAETQPLAQRTDVAAIGTLELLLGVQAIEGVALEISVEDLMGMPLASEDGWRVAATFGSVTVSDTWRKCTLTGLLRYLCYRVTSVTGKATISQRGVGRRWYRRGFAPTALSGCAAWHRAKLGVTLNGSAVSARADQSGHAQDLAHSAGASKPLWVESTVNAQLARRLDGGDDFLNAAFTLTTLLQNVLVDKTAGTSVFDGSELAI